MLLRYSHSWFSIMRAPRDGQISDALCLPYRCYATPYINPQKSHSTCRSFRHSRRLIESDAKVPDVFARAHVVSCSSLLSCRQSTKHSQSRPSISDAACTSLGTSVMLHHETRRHVCIEKHCTHPRCANVVMQSPTSLFNHMPTLASEYAYMWCLVTK
jgi:hypothetical protein